MTENLYRVIKAVLLAVLTIGALLISTRIAENGRYLQYDRAKDSLALPSGSTMQTAPTHVIDTRTGAIREARRSTD